ncbi:FkbM family methyltransferase [Micromonospora sp. WMMA1363]|uniref:FkbM family methyltransferase n=1 Tax=Micromonospora sp. WMMA1363 TaxID=3053985 RepID=UPI00259CB624|nr:FkbM family methyltransferase [Micromonospora sp. WMMA1363]MDM4719047.1 FkbM family methyltransferase [Micromonospora sp. WMMA1363]
MHVNAEVVESVKADPAASPLRRSLDVAYGDPKRAAAMDRFYAQFVHAEDLVFDVGAHVGDRTGGFRRLGARVVAVEPQPLCARTIRALYGGDDRVILVEAACGATPGTLELHVNSANPTVSTASPRFVQAAGGADGWRQETWDARIDVPTTTLDALIAEHGVPAFVKIDVEGFEDAVLAGLTRPLPALSFEFTTIDRGVARAGLDRATALGFTRFNLALGDTMALAEPAWMSATAMAAVLDTLPHAANSGDVYCTP